MRVSLDWSALRKTKRYEYAVRFFFGGIITVLAGLIAKAYGPTVGGYFWHFRRSSQPGQRWSKSTSERENARPGSGKPPAPDKQPLSTHTELL